MKLRIEISDDCTADEVIIHCKEKDETVCRLEAAFTEIVKRDTQLALFDGSSEHYISMRDILFLEIKRQINYSSYSQLLLLQ